MCYVIVTCRSLLWMLLTISAALAMISAVITPKWLIGYPRSNFRTPVNPSSVRPQFEKEILDSIAGSSELALSLVSTDDSQGRGEARDSYRPTLGLYNRCTVIHHADFRGVSSQRLREHCAPFVDSFDMPDRVFPDFWKAAIVFLGLGLTLLSVTVLSSLLGCCCRSICKKSIFTVSGLVQAIAGLFFIFGLVMFPAGWGNEKVRDYCGQNAAPFVLDQCDLGWAFYAAMGSTFLVFVCSILSVQAEISTSSDDVQDEILKGKTLICLP